MCVSRTSIGCADYSGSVAVASDWVWPIRRDDLARRLLARAVLFCWRGDTARSAIAVLSATDVLVAQTPEYAQC
jgi:hypothetical protein